MEGNRYSNSKVYKLINSVDDTFYIGSTTTQLCKRLSYHRNRSHEEKYKNCKLYEHLNRVDFENVKIILIQEFNLENKEQLRREEQIYIDRYKHDPNCLNSMNAFSTEDQKAHRKKEYRRNHKEQARETNKRYVMTHKEPISQKNKLYYKSNKEEINRENRDYQIANKGTISEYQKQYRSDNREKINEQRKKTYVCLCGSVIRLDSKTKHERSLKHLNFLQSEK